MRVLICAGRYYADDRRCRQVLDAFQRLHETRVVIHGGSQFLGAHIAVSYTHLTLPTTPYV